jgi:hypothetical protein
MRSAIIMHFRRDCTVSKYPIRIDPAAAPKGTRPKGIRVIKYEIITSRESLEEVLATFLDMENRVSGLHAHAEVG